MSRIGTQPVELPEGVTATIDGSVVTMKGPKGELSFEVASSVSVTQGEEGIVVTVEHPSTQAAIWGTSRARIANLVEGVTNGFEKKLTLEGVGYRIQVSGKKVTLNIGFSHPVELEAPEGVEVAVDDNNVITISGINKQLVGQFAADIRAVRPVEPYKGKGIKYIDEHVRRKVGKRVVAGGAPGA